MDRNEYLAQLRALLAGRVPPAELERLCAYYEEYFDEAGADQTQRVIQELGAPGELAGRIMGERRAESRPGPESARQEAPPPRERRGLGTLWTVLLAVCAAPIAIPLILVALILVVFVAVAAVVLGGVVCVAVGVGVGMAGFSALFSAGLTTTMLFSGLGLLSCGVGLLLIAGSVALAGLCFRGAAALLRRMLNGREARA